jgi:cytidylate kinase
LQVSNMTEKGLEHMAKNTVITIGRQYGSGGRDVGKLLAERMGVPCYDKELLAMAAKQSGLCQELFENHDEKPTNSFLYSLVMDTYSTGYSSATFTDMPINHKVFLAQFDTIKKIAEEGSCVLVGRCADYALADSPNVVNVFVHADLQERIVRIAKRHDVTNAKAREMIIKTDKKRASYYNYYTSKKWGEAAGYHLSLDTGALGIDGAVHMIQEFVAYKEKDHEKI